jgi:predicted nucleic acid-binding protein
MHAVDEVRNNIVKADHGERFDRLLAKTRIVSDANLKFIPADIELAQKDRPILAAAIAASVNYLVTGDKNHFMHLYNHRIAGVTIVPPTEFLDKNAYRLTL